MSSENIESIVTSTIFELSNPGEYSERYSYSRYGNPTRDALESSLAAVEQAKFAATFSSLTAASLAVLSVLEAGDSVCFGDALSCEKLAGLVSYLDFYHFSFDELETLKDSIKPDTAMVWIESPMSPLLTVLDIKAIVDEVRHKTDAIIVVNNTLMTSHFQQPLKLGADVVVYSTSEYVGGHGDVNMGAIVTNEAKIYEKLRYFQYSSGFVPSPFDCYLLNRSLKTLALRMEKHSENSFAVASFLDSHPKIEKVFHPALKSHKNHDVALRQSYGHSGILSFYVRGSLEQTKTLFKSFKLILVSESLGGTETNAAFPWLMSHSDMSEAQRLAAGVTKNLIRLSVGLEEVNELIADLQQALDKI